MHSLLAVLHSGDPSSTESVDYCSTSYNLVRSVIYRHRMRGQHASSTFSLLIYTVLSRLCEGFYEYTWLKSLVNTSANTFDIRPECTALANTIYSTLTNTTEKSLFSPTLNGRCAWLRAIKLDVDTGIGHAASFLNANVLLAMQYNLTLYTDFGPSGHDLNDNYVDEFYSFGCAFGHSRVPPLDARVVPTTEKDLPLLYQANLHLLDCAKGHTIFDLERYTNWGHRIRNGVVPSPNCNYFYTSSILQKIFLTSFTTEKRTMYIPSVVSTALNRGELVISVHLRRGDILEQAKHMINRYISIETVIDALRHLLLETRLMRSKTAVSVFILTEKAPDSDSVIDFNPIKRQTVNVNVTSALLDVCSPNTKCSVRVLMDADADALQSFAALCASNILIAAPSGFSHLAAMLCKPQLVFEVPFWCPYTVESPLNVHLLHRKIEDNSFTTLRKQLSWLQ